MKKAYTLLVVWIGSGFILQATSLYMIGYEFRKLKGRISRLEATKNEQAKKLDSLDPRWGGQVRTQESALFLLSKLEQIESGSEESPGPVMDEHRASDQADWVCSYIGRGKHYAPRQADLGTMVERLKIVYAVLPKFKQEHPDTSPTAFSFLDRSAAEINEACQQF